MQSGGGTLFLAVAAEAGDALVGGDLGDGGAALGAGLAAAAVHFEVVSVLVHGEALLLHAVGNDGGCLAQHRADGLVEANLSFRR